jgi:superfamily II DNA helicase RecQ
MRFHFVTVPTFGSSAAEEALNLFVASHRVLSVERQFVANGAQSAWAVCVTYEAGESTPVIVGADGKKKPVDYRDLLSEHDFALFVKLRAMRKTTAEKEGVPPYAIFTNEHLAEIVRRRVTTRDALSKLAGVGDAKVERYSAAVFEIMKSAPTSPATAPTPQVEG